jgi:hypothetical protein
VQRLCNSGEHHPFMETLSVEPDRCGCRYEQHAPAHHRRLVSLEQEPMTALVELIEMAATWDEIEYGETEPVIPPNEWIAFAEDHAWMDGDRVFDALVALASVAFPARSRRLAPVTPLQKTASGAVPRALVTV